jgi:predicted enzyme related to lactoylglutathione lyase
MRAGRRGHVVERTRRPASRVVTLGHGRPDSVVDCCMKPRLVGINHVALQVDDIEEAVAFYTDLFEPTAVDRSVPGAAFLRMGDQFLALFERGPRTEEPHFGLVVDDKEAARRTLEAAGVEVLPGRFFDIRDPSGNRVQIVQYDEIQFTKTDRILSGMGLELPKSEQALAELRAQDLAD